VSAADYSIETYND